MTQYVANTANVAAFLAAFKSGNKAITGMALALLAEFKGAADAVECKARQSVFVAALREEFKADLSKKVREALFGKGRSEKKNKADYKAGTMADDVADAWSNYNMIGKRAGQFAVIRDAMFDRPEVSEAVAKFIDSKGKAPTYTALERLAVGDKEQAGEGGGEGEEQENAPADEWNEEKFLGLLTTAMAYADKHGKGTEGLAIMVKLTKERAKSAK